jgi:hypothetical protein
MWLPAMSLKKTLPSVSTAGPSRKQMVAAIAGAVPLATRLSGGGGALLRLVCGAAHRAVTTNKAKMAGIRLYMALLAYFVFDISSGIPFLSTRSQSVEASGFNKTAIANTHTKMTN